MLNQKRTNSTKTRTVKFSKHINKGFINSWMDGSKESKSLDWQAEPVDSGWKYECRFDLKTGKIKIASLKEGCPWHEL